MLPKFSKAVFLDRDGVIVHNREQYIRSWADVKIYPLALEALAKLAELDTYIFLVTNQSAIGRGLVSYEMVAHINQHLIEIIQKNKGRIDRVFICPHAPQENCNCRKPQPGMILQARQEYQLDLSQSWLVGDAFSDLMAAQNAGVNHKILVQTGRGNKQFAQHRLGLQKISFQRTKNLETAVRLIQAENQEFAEQPSLLAKE